MAKIDKKDINGRADQMENAWEDGAPGIEFKGQTLAALKAQRVNIATKESEIADEKASIKNKENSLIDDYKLLNSIMVDVRSGVAGHKDYGEDSPLYGGMGFVMKSQRKSGLTRKKKPTENN